MSTDEAKELLAVSFNELRHLAAIQLVDRRWPDGRRETGIRLPAWLLERGLGGASDAPLSPRYATGRESGFGD